MENGFFHTAKPFTKLLLVLFLMLTCYLVVFGLGILVSIPVFKISTREVISIIEDNRYENHIAMVKMLQVLYSTGLFLVPALLAAFLINKKTWDFLSVKRYPDLKVVMLITLLMLAIIPLINYIAFLNESLSLPDRWSALMDRIHQSDETARGMMKAFLTTDSIGGLLFNLFMIALIPAVGEELLFRGILQRIFSDWFRNRHLGIWVVALLFSIMHYQFMGFLPRIILGASFGYLYIWTRSIWAPILAHFLNNGIAVVYYHFYFRGNLSVDPDSIGMENNTLLFVLFSTIISAMILEVIRRDGKKSADAQLL